MAVRFDKKQLAKRLPSISILVVIILLVLLGLQTNNSQSLKQQLKTLQSQDKISDNNNSIFQGQIADLSSKSTEATTNYDNLKQAVLHDPAHAEQIGHNLLISCDPSSPLYIKSVNYKLTDDQKKAQCGQAVQDVFIDDYVQKDGNIQ